jgi:hypothetical protein
MHDSSIQQLLEDLKNPDENVRNQATVEFWRIWFIKKADMAWSCSNAAKSCMKLEM